MRSISCVSAPNAHIRPQYRRPHSTVATTVKTARRYQARLYLKIGRFQSSSAKTFTIEMSWLFMKPRYTTATANVTYFSFDALAEETDQRQGGERAESRQVQRLRADDLPPARRLVFFVCKLPAIGQALAAADAEERGCASEPAGRADGCARSATCVAGDAHSAGKQQRCDERPFVTWRALP